MSNARTRVRCAGGTPSRSSHARASASSASKMLTTSAEDRDLRRCYAHGANSYIVKPVDMERFFRAVQDIGTYWLELNQPDPNLTEAAS